MNKQRTFTQLLLEQAKEQEAANVPRVDTPPQTKLERKKTARQRIIDALNGIGAQVDPNPRELKFVETKGREMAELEKEITELEKQIAESEQKIADAAKQIESPEVIEDKQEKAAEETVDALAKLLPEIKTNDTEIKDEIKSAIKNAVKSRGNTPEKKSPEKSPEKKSSEKSHEEIRKQLQEIEKELAAEYDKEYNIFKKQDEKGISPQLPTLPSAKEIENTPTVVAVKSGLDVVLNPDVLIPDSKNTSSWIVNLCIFLSNLYSKFPDSKTIATGFSNIGSLLVFFLFTMAPQGIYMVCNALITIFKYIMWSLSVLVTYPEWSKHFNNFKEIMSSFDCKQVWGALGYDVESQVTIIGGPVIKEHLLRGAPGDGDDGDNGNIFQPHIQARFDAKPISPAKPKVAIRNSSFIPEDSNSESGANGCKAIQSERTCESSELKCNWFKNRRPYQCKSSKVDKNREMVQAEITRLRQLTHDQIKKYVNNPDSAIYQDGWRRGPKKLMDKVLELKGTHGDSVQGSTHNTNKKGHQGGNKTRRKQNNKTRRKQNNKTRRKQNK